MSENQERLIIVNERYYKSTAIYYLYAQKNKESNYLWLYPDIDDEHIAEIRDVRPDESSKWGNEPENWISKTGKDHTFDVLKYAYLAKDFALQTFSRTRYRFGRAQSIMRRFEKVQQKTEQKQQETARSSWFNR